MHRDSAEAELTCRAEKLTASGELKLIVKDRVHGEQLAPKIRIMASNPMSELIKLVQLIAGRSMECLTLPASP